MSERKSEEAPTIDSSRGQFIDPLFAVIIAAALAETVVAWTKAGAPRLFEIAIVVVGFVNLLSSWFGYHKSVNSKPIKGALRFTITIVLLPIYLLTLILFATPFVVIASLYGSVFFLWSTWEYFKFVEHGSREHFLSLQLQPYNLIAYGAFLIVAISYAYPHKYAEQADWLGLALILLAISVLRILKSADGSGGHMIRRGLRRLFLGT